MTQLIPDDEVLLRRVTMRAGKVGQWHYEAGRFVVPGNAWEDSRDEPSVYLKSVVNINLLLSNCGASPAPEDNGCFGIHAGAVRSITTILQRDGKGKPISDRPFTVDAVSTPSECESPAHAVVKTIEPVHSAKREIRQLMQQSLSLIADEYINGVRAGGGWERIPPGLQELQART